MLLALFALYGIWFFRAATNDTTNERSVPRVKADGTKSSDAPPVKSLVAHQAHGDLDAKPQQNVAAAPVVAPESAKSSAASAVTKGNTAANDRSEADSGCSLSKVATLTQERVGSFNGEQWLSLKLPRELVEPSPMTLTAWVLLQEAPPTGEVMSIQTIAASKHSGCQPDEWHNGIALFVNAWNTDSGQLYLSWGNRLSGCEELSSAGRVIEPGSWAFVSASFTAEGAALISVNGKIVAHTGRHLGDMKTTGKPWVVDRVPGPRNLRVGTHTDGTHPLHGFVAQFGVWDAALTEEQVLLAMHGCSAQLGLQAAILVPFLGQPKQSSFDATEVTGTQASNVISLPDEQHMLPGLVDFSAASGKVRVRQFSSTPLPSSSLSLETKELGWPLAWLPPRNVNFTDAAKINESESTALFRRDKVKGVMQRAWIAYRKHAWVWI